MKTGLLTLSIFALAALSASAQDQPQAKWASLMGGASGDQSTAIALGKDGSALWLSTAASTEAAPEIYLNGEEMFKGALYNAGNSSNNNLSLICTNPDGSAKWVIYSDSGDFGSGQGNIVADNEGNYIFTAKVRHTDGMLDIPMNIIDAENTKVEFGGTVEKRYNRLLIAKTNSEGAILWTKLVDVSTAPAPAASGNNADFTSDAISSSALTVDDAGNIYVGGNYCAPITIDDVTLQPVNVSAWTGDSQTSCGNMFVLKLDENGNYVDSLVGVGDINGYSVVQDLVWNNGNLYVAGYARGDGEASFSFAGEKLTPSSTLSVIVGRLDNELSADWLKCCNGSPVNNKSALQNIGMSIYGNSLWMCGMFNQRITDADDAEKYVEATQEKLREGFIINFDKESGEWIASADSKDGFPEISKLTGYLRAIQNLSHLDKVYVYGYAMDATIGIFLREYDALTLTPNTDHAWSLATGGGVPTAIAIAYDPATASAFISGRGNKAFTLMGDITTEATKNWDVLMAEFYLPKDLSTIVENCNALESDPDAPVYDLQGRRVATLRNTATLTPGVYIANKKKFIVR